MKTSELLGQIEWFNKYNGKNVILCQQYGTNYLKDGITQKTLFVGTSRSVLIL